MPTPDATFALVAAKLGDVDPADANAVEKFYRRRFVAYPLPVRELIFDFLSGLSGTPSEDALLRLRDAVALPLSDVPEVDAPVWDQKYGPVMDSVPDAAEGWRQGSEARTGGRSPPPANLANSAGR